MIAHGLGISPRTVEVHRAHMLERLRTRTIAEAIRLAVMAGLRSAVRWAMRPRDLLDKACGTCAVIERNTSRSPAKAAFNTSVSAWWSEIDGDQGEARSPT